MVAISHPPSADNVSVPDALKAYSQFGVWKLLHKPGQPKPSKIPCNPITGAPVSTTDATAWTDYATACRAFQSGNYDGIAFVFTDADPFAFIDLDDCHDAASGTWMPHAVALLQQLPAAAWETSQSGKGLHGIAQISDKAAFANKARKWADPTGNRYEFYTTGRFVAFGHCNWSRLDFPADSGAALGALVPDRQSSSAHVIEWEDAPRADYAGPADDDELIRRAVASKSPLAVMGRQPPFAALWEGDATILGQFFPDQSGRAYDHSGAELALANALAWWTGCNPARIECLMHRAPLCQREKWQKRADYRARTIVNAVADPNRSYFKSTDRRAQQMAAAMAIGDDLQFSIVPDILTLDTALNGLVFVADGSQVINRATKRVRKYDDALREYAASLHAIDTGKIDDEGRPKLQYVPVLKVWLQHHIRHSVDAVAWAPGEAEFCNSPERTQAGERAYNLWSDLRILPAPPNWQDWARPFLDHVAYLVPVETERERFLSWLAHIFQSPGELPHVCYLFIATVTGIGRGTLGSILARALRGYVAVNMNVDALFGGYNGRISQKLLATVDEIREGNSMQRYEKQEAFKSKITEENRALNPKYGRQSVEKNCCRWLLFSNHLDALPFDNSDRRIIVVENPTVRRNPQDYAYLHSLIDYPQFIASVQQFFLLRNLSGFNAHEPAPLNAIKQRALASLESQADRAARQFAETWPDELATVSDLRDFMGEDAPASRAMAHVIERAGMQSGDKQKVNGKTETVLIVRGSFTRDDLKGVDKSVIAARIFAARAKFLGGN